MARERALAAYRNILRSARLAFQGDTTVLTAARHEARTAFQTDRHLDGASEQAGKQVHMAEDVARILRENVVQARKGAEEKGPYKLRIHEHTERGDNESIKLAGKMKTDLSGVKCCSA